MVSLERRSALFQREEENKKVTVISKVTVTFYFANFYCVNANVETIVEKTADSAVMLKVGGGVE